MFNFISAILNLFQSGVGEKIGRAATGIGIIATLTPVAIWFAANKDETFVVLSYGDIAFWGMVIAAQIFVAYGTRPHSVARLTQAAQDWRDQ